MISKPLQIPNNGSYTQISRILYSMNYYTRLSNCINIVTPIELLTDLL